MTLHTVALKKWAPCFDQEEQSARLAPLRFALAVAGEHLAGQPDQLVQVMRDIGEQGARLLQAPLWPAG